MFTGRLKQNGFWTNSGFCDERIQEGRKFPGRMLNGWRTADTSGLRLVGPKPFWHVELLDTVQWHLGDGLNTRTDGWMTEWSQVRGQSIINSGDGGFSCWITVNEHNIDRSISVCTDMGQEYGRDDKPGERCQLSDWIAWRTWKTRIRRWPQGIASLARHSAGVACQRRRQPKARSTPATLSKQLATLLPVASTLLLVLKGDIGLQRFSTNLIKSSS